MGKLAKAIAHRPKAVVIASMLLVVLSGVLAAPVMNSLSRSTNDFQDPNAETLSARHVIEKATGTDAQLGVVVLIETPGSPATSAVARERIRQVERIVKSDKGTANYFDYLTKRDPAFIARDGKSTYVAVRTVKGAGEGTGERLKAALDGYSWARAGGSDIIFKQIGEQVSSDLARAEMIAFPILFLLSLLVFRGLIAALLPVFVGGVSIVITLLLLRIANETAGLSVFAVNIVTGLGLGLAIDYSLFMVSRYREELAKYGPGPDALINTMKTAGRTVFFSSLTVAIAMSALLIFPLRFLYSVGLGGMLVSLVGMAVALILLPAVLHLLGERVNALAPARWQRKAMDSARGEMDGFWYRLAQGVMRRPIPVALLSAAALLLLTFPSLHIVFNAADATALPKGADARDVSDRLDSMYPPSSAAQAVNVLVYAPRDAAKQIHTIEQRLASIPNAKGVEKPRPLSKNLWQLDVLTVGEARSPENQQIVRAIRSMQTPYKKEVTGSAAFFVDEKDGIADHLPLAIALLAAGTFILLFLLTGSILLPIKALIMNVLTVGAAFGILVLIFQDGRFEGLLAYTSNGGLETTQPVLLFAMAFGLSTDYGVFLLSRIKEARDSGMGDRDSVAFGLERTGRIVTAAALLFCVAIAAFASSEVLFIKQVGLGTAVAVAIDATLVRALLVPSLMALLGKWNWWAPKPLARLHAKLGFTH